MPGSDILYSPGRVAGIHVSKVPGCFSKGLSWLQKVNLSSLKLTMHIIFKYNTSQRLGNGLAEIE